MGSQLISNVVRSLFLAMVLTGLLTGSVAEAASYKKTDGTIVDPILAWQSGAPAPTHPYSGPDLEPGAHLAGADLFNANLRDADLSNTDLSDAYLRGASLHDADLSGADLTGADLSISWVNGADLSNANLTKANLNRSHMNGADLSNANLFDASLYGTRLDKADLYGTDLSYTRYVDQILSRPYYYGNTLLPVGFDPAAANGAHGNWRLAPYCDFTPDAACDLADINQMFQAGNLVTGVATSGDTDRLDLFENDTIDAWDITWWLGLAAIANGHGSPYRRGDTEFDRNVDITDFNVLASHFDPTGVEDPINGPFWNEGNFDGDGDIDITDFNLLAANFAPPGYATSAIPEPTTMILASLALILTSVSFRLSKNGCD